MWCHLLGSRCGAPRRVLFALAVCCYLAASGCESPRKVMATWTEQKLGETHPQFHVGQTVVAAVAGDDGAEGWRVAFGREQHKTYEQHHLKLTVQAVRYATQEHVDQTNKEAVDKLGAKVVGYPLVIGMTYGVLTPLVIGAEAEDASKAGRLAETERGYLRRLKAGEEEIRDGALTFKREIRGTPKVLRRKAKRERVDPLPIARTDVRLVRAGRLLAEATTDERGQAVFLCPGGVSRALSLQPSVLTAQVKEEGAWKDAAKVEMGETAIASLLRGAQEASMREKGELTGRPFPRGELHLPARLAPGGKFEVRVTAHVDGSGPCYGLVARTESELLAAHGLEFRFGKVDPGQAVTLTRSITIPPDAAPGDVPVRLKWSDYNNYAPEAQERTVTVSAPQSRARAKRPSR
jgi:hypothetical protein